MAEAPLEGLGLRDRRFVETARAAVAAQRGHRVRSGPAPIPATPSLPNHPDN
jgi:hypothetical protein